MSAGIGGYGTDGGSPCVLVVDDDEHILDMVQMALSDEGFEVATAANGADALRAIRMRQPNVIILDLWMPVMDGWQFLDEYRQQPGPHAPVIALTAAQFQPSQQTAVDAHDFIPKPFSLDTLIGLVNLYTGR